MRVVGEVGRCFVGDEGPEPLGEDVGQAGERSVTSWKGTSPIGAVISPGIVEVEVVELRSLVSLALLRLASSPTLGPSASSAKLENRSVPRRGRHRRPTRLGHRRSYPQPVAKSLRFSSLGCIGNLAATPSDRPYVRRPCLHPFRDASSHPTLRKDRPTELSLAERDKHPDSQSVHCFAAKPGWSPSKLLITSMRSFLPPSLGCATGSWASLARGSWGCLRGMIFTCEMHCWNKTLPCLCLSGPHIPRNLLCCPPSATRRNSGGDHAAAVRGARRPSGLRGRVRQQK